MSIEQTLRARLTAAMKQRDLKTANVIRMINTKVMEKRTSKGFKGDVDDALYLEVIASYKKSLEKGRKEFEAAGDKGAEHVADLDFEIAICQEYLPQQLGEAETAAAVDAAIAELGATDPKMKGRVVGAVMKQHKGVVDPALVQRLVGEKLNLPE